MTVLTEHALSDGASVAYEPKKTAGSQWPTQRLASVIKANTCCVLQGVELLTFVDAEMLTATQTRE
jgi:hypothetical protein